MDTSSNHCKLPTRPMATIVAVSPLCNCDGQPHFGINLQVQGEVLRLKLTQEDLVMLTNEVQRYGTAQRLAAIGVQSPMSLASPNWDVSPHEAEKVCPPARSSMAPMGEL